MIQRLFHPRQVSLLFICSALLNQAGVLNFRVAPLKYMCDNPAACVILDRNGHLCVQICQAGFHLHCPTTSAAAPLNLHADP